MNRAALARAGVRRAPRRHVGLFLGALLTTAVFVGALAVGDSVKATLRDQALDRIGRIDVALDAGDRFVTAALARALARDGREVAALVSLDGVAVTPDGTRRANGVRVLGVDAAFAPLSRSGRPRPAPAPGTAHLSPRLARQLGLDEGGTAILRVERPTAMPRETTMGDADDPVTALRVEVAGVVAPEDGGRFTLEAHQIPPYVAFVDREWLAAELEIAGRANLLLATGDPAAASAALRTEWTLDDLELTIDRRDDHAALRSRRVLLDPPIEAAVRATGVAGLAGSAMFVERIARSDDAEGPSLPYSIVGALQPVGDVRTPALRAAAALVPDDLGPDGIVLHDAAADRLGAAPGASLRIDAFALGDDLRVTVRSRPFSVRSVVPLAGAAADPTWMPRIEGLDRTDREGSRT
ncbi:MAG: hypothetical protein ACF8XB_15165, partial [Planctomycetota bacterium JB042]